MNTAPDEVMTPNVTECAHGCGTVTGATVASPWTCSGCLERLAQVSAVVAAIDISTMAGWNLRALLLRLLCGEPVYDYDRDPPETDKASDIAIADAVRRQLVGSTGYGLELTPLGREVAERMRPEPWLSKEQDAVYVIRPNTSALQLRGALVGGGAHCPSANRALRARGQDLQYPAGGNVKRTALKRKTPLKRGEPLARTGKLKPRNSSRSKAAREQDFGEEADTVRKMPCTVPGCTAGPCQPAHVKSRGASGGRFDIIPLCAAHHREQHDTGIKTFAAWHGLDLRAEADRIALMHSDPLGLRGVARRWVELAAAIDDPAIHHDSEEFAERLHRAPSEGDREALLGWVRRRMHAWSGRFPAPTCGDREAIAHAVMLDLGEPFTSDPSGEHGITWALCSAAEWPS